MKIFRKHPIYLIIILILTVCSSASSVYAGYSLGLLYESLEQTSFQLLFRNSFFIISIWILSIAINYILDCMIAYTLKVINVDIRKTYTHDISNLKYRDYTRNNTGYYISRLTNDIERFDESALLSIFSLMGNMLKMLFSFIAITSMHSYLAYFTIASTFIMLIIPNITKPIIGKYSNNVSNRQEAFVGILNETFSNYIVFKTNNLMKKFRDRINNESNNLEQDKLKFQFIKDLIMRINSAINILFQIGTLMFTVYLVINNAVYPGAILSIANLVGVFFSSSLGVFNDIVTYNSSKPITNKLSEFDWLNEQDYNTASVALTDQIQSIKSGKLSFNYDENMSIFNDINLTFEFPNKYVIIGESGSGKSTLLKCIAGLYESYSGKIFYNNFPLKELNLPDVWNQVVYLDQTSTLFTGTIKENLTLGEEYSEEEIIEVLERVNAYNFVCSNDEGLDYMVTEGGKNFSGGQKQRLAIARGLLRKPRILLIDEATSALDERNKKLIESTILQDPELMVIMISHNINQDIEAYIDKIIQLDDIQ